MSQLDIALASIGAVVLCLGIISQAIKRSPLQEPLIAVAVGILIGPYGLAWLDIAAWGDPITILEAAARLTLAIGLMGVALRLTRQDIIGLWRPVGLLLIVAMLGMCALSSAIAGWWLGVPVWIAVLLGAALTPTDPVVASSIVTGRFAEEHLSDRIRDSISLESGANDGLAYMFVMLPILLVQAGPGEAWQRWLTETLLLGVVVAAAVGVAMGWGAARLLHWARQRRLIESYSFLTYTVALSLFTLGGATLIGADALISVFAAGLAFNLASETGEKHEEESVQEAVNKLFTLPMFVLFGLALPFSDWVRIGWPLLALAMLILVLRRLPVVAALFPALRGTYSAADCAYMGWFGPIGIAAVYYAAFAVKHTGEELIWTAASAAILASILAHSLTAAPFTRWYARRNSPSCGDLAAT
jgi:sodium/hydrogen antiporter